MDITVRKYKFIEEFMKIVTPEKLDQLEDVLHAGLVTQDGFVLTEEQKSELDRREARHLSGESKSNSWAEVKQRLISNHGLQTEN